MIYIITAVHNNLNDTKKLLVSLKKQTLKDFKIIIVDDGSSDGTETYISDKFPETLVVKGEGNLWWTRSLNLGIKEILTKAKSGDLIFTVNNDCILQKNAIENIYNFSKSKKKTITGSIVLDKKTYKILESGVSVDWENLKFSKTDMKNKEQIDALPTKGTLFPVSVFKDIGLFDARHFPHYFSDYEFTIRAKRNGYKLLVCPDAVVYNRSERTGSSKLSFSKKSKINPLTQLNMVIYVCPPEYRLKAIFLLISKLFHGKK